MGTTSVTSNVRIHPCLRGDPLPSSATQPGLITELRHFTVDGQVPDDYPYDIAPSQGRQPHIIVYNVPFYQVSGLGPPPTDLTGTNPGDVYIDRSPDKEALYGKLAHGWKRWYDPQPWDKTDANVVRHPHFGHRKLWCSTARGVSWYTWNTVRNNQDRAKLRGLVSQNVYKTEETRWREAAVLIVLSLEEELKVAGPKAITPPPRSSMSCSPPFESRDASPAPVLGKRKAMQGGAECKASLKAAIERLKKESEELAAKNATLETQLPGHSEAEAQLFTAWIDKVLGGGFKIHELAVKNGLGPKGEDYLILEADLAAVEAQLAQEVSRCEEAQSALSRTVAEDEELVTKWERAKSDLERAFRLLKS